jgi:hypothetical protein
LRSAGRVAALAFLKAMPLLGNCFVSGHNEAYGTGSSKIKGRCHFSNGQFVDTLKASPHGIECQLSFEVYAAEQ